MGPPYNPAYYTLQNKVMSKIPFSELEKQYAKVDYSTRYDTWIVNFKLLWRDRVSVHGEDSASEAEIKILYQLLLVLEHWVSGNIKCWVPQTYAA